MKLASQAIIIVLMLAGMLSACKKEVSCPTTTELGQLSWSKETENWFPEKYLDENATLRFESEAGDILEFVGDEIHLLEGNFKSFLKACEIAEGSTRIRWATRRLAKTFITQDSLQISFWMGVWNEKLALNHVVEADFYDWIALSVSRKQNPGKALGRIRIVTDLRNSELEEIDHSTNEFEKIENFEFMGNQYPTIFTDEKPDYENANIYFTRGQGLIGFKDEAGVKWKLIE